ncbi:MAG: phosphate signaling complex protein PhoU [Thermodesulfobacteriota bacterium]|nr:phosphate signaling complex protein PhoU [Thermodesulfobacteriota bacterium]
MTHQITFQREIDNVKKKFMILGSMVEDRLQKTSLAMQTKDHELLQEIIVSDWEIDEMEIEVEEECLKILALHQPVARDLRLLIAIIKINNELERIADIAANIAQRMQIISRNTTQVVTIDFQPMFGKVLAMFKLGLDALVTEDADLARRIFLKDKEVNELRNHAYRRVTKALDAEPGHAKCLVNLYLLARHLERIGDRVKNIAEEVIYLVEGTIVRGETR